MDSTEGKRGRDRASNIPSKTRKVCFHACYKKPIGIAPVEIMSTLAGLGRVGSDDQPSARLSGHGAVQMERGRAFDAEGPLRKDKPLPLWSGVFSKAAVATQFMLVS